MYFILPTAVLDLGHRSGANTGGEDFKSEKIKVSQFQKDFLMS